MTSQPVEHSSNTEPASPQRRALVVRRAPKFVPFLIAGAILGLVVAGVLTLISPSIEAFEPSSIFGFFAVLLILPGAGLGAVVALILDRVSFRRTTQAVVESVPENDGEQAGSAAL